MYDAYLNKKYVSTHLVRECFRNLLLIFKRDVNRDILIMDYDIAI